MGNHGPARGQADFGMAVDGGGKPPYHRGMPVLAEEPTVSLPPGHDPRLDAIERKVRDGVRLTEEDGLALYETRDVHRVLAMADLVRRRLHGDVAFYNVNRHINYTNICALSCKFCAFHRKKDQDGAYEMDTARIVQEVQGAAAAGATEIHNRFGDGDAKAKIRQVNFAAAEAFQRVKDAAVGNEKIEIVVYQDTFIFAERDPAE